MEAEHGQTKGCLSASAAPGLMKFRGACARNTCTSTRGGRRQTRRVRHGPEYNECAGLIQNGSRPIAARDMQQSLRMRLCRAAAEPATIGARELLQGCQGIRIGPIQMEPRRDEDVTQRRAAGRICTRRMPGCGCRRSQRRSARPPRRSRPSSGRSAATGCRGANRGGLRERGCAAGEREGVVRSTRSAAAAGASY